MESMDSFSLDENGNCSFSFPALVSQSTPRKIKPGTVTKNNLVCKICQKQYQLEFYYRKHLLSHDSQKDVPVTSDKRKANETALSAMVDISIEDMSLSMLSTTQPAAPFKVPSLPQKQKKLIKKPNFVCTYCLKPYMSTKAYQSHVRMHVIQDACRRYPNTEKIMENIEDISTKALTEVSNSVACGTYGMKFRQLLGHIIEKINSNEKNYKDFSTSVAEELVQSVAGKMAILPSAFMGNLFDKMEEILSDSSLCSEFLSKLSLEDFDEDTQSQFFLEFMIEITLGIFRFISQTYRNFYTPRPTPVHLLELEERQVTYYVAGFIMRSYLKQGRRNKNNVKWQSITNVLKTKILCEKPEGDVEAQWTADVDRGGLLYVRSPVQEFFKRVAVIVYSCERANGSVDYDKVLDKVSKSNITSDWDDIIGDSLSEVLSLNVMNDAITMFAKTIGRGIAKRRSNELRQKPVISMPTRVSVARRKKK